MEVTYREHEHRPFSCIGMFWRDIFKVSIGVVALIAVLAMAPSKAWAQDSLRIAAIVNDDVISGYDLFTRMRLVMGLSRIQDSPQARRRLAPQVLQSLIDEQLQSQEAKRLGISAQESQVNGMLRSLERANGIPANGIDAFLSNLRVPKSNLVSELETRIVWEAVIGRLYGPGIDVGDGEVNDTLAEMQANTGKPEYLVSEIFLPINNASQINQVRQLTGRIIQQIRAGAPFSSLASNFSQSPTAATGGDLGWVQTHQLDPDIASVIRQLTPGALSEPLETVSGIYILSVRDKRISQGPIDPMATVNIQQLFVPISEQPDLAEIQRQQQLAQNLRARSSSCSAMEQMNQATGSPASGNLGDLRRTGLAPVIRDALQGLSIGIPTPVIRMPRGFAVLMICSQSSSEDAIDNIRNQIRQRLFRERLGNAARRHLRELRRNAFIDIRL